MLAAPELVVIAYLPRRERRRQGKRHGSRRDSHFEGITRRDEHRSRAANFAPACAKRSSAGLSERFQGLGLGENFVVQDGTFTVVGIFEAGGGAVESEIWTDQRVLGQVTNRTGGMSSLQLRAVSDAAQEQLINKIKADEQIALNAMTEEQYFAEQAEQGKLIKYIGNMIAVFLTIGAMFAVANTMYGASRHGPVRSARFGHSDSGDSAFSRRFCWNRWCFACWAPCWESLVPWPSARFGPAR